MRQEVLPYTFEYAGPKRRATAHAGLCPYLELACVAGLFKSIREHVHVCSEEQGYTDEQIIMALVSLNLAGGQCVDDLQILESDDGFGKVFRMAERYHLSGAERKKLDKRFRKGRERHTPSPSVVFRFLEAFHDAEQEKQRELGKAFIPKPNEALLGLIKVNADLIAFMQGRRPAEMATLDMDATIVQTYKRDALYSYKGDKAYQPFNVYWSEQGMLLYSEFRDGNVPAGHEQLRVFQNALTHLPKGVRTVRLRSDTAGYQHELLRYCAAGKNERFGVIEFAIGCDVTQEFRRAVAKVEERDWKPLYDQKDGIRFPTGREWAEVPLYVPCQTSKTKNDPDYRYVATREVLKQQPLPELRDEHAQLALPFKTLTMGAPDQRKEYKVFGTVTNLPWSGDLVLRWLYQPRSTAGKRCTRSRRKTWPVGNFPQRTSARTPRGGG